VHLFFQFILKEDGALHILQGEKTIPIKLLLVRNMTPGDFF